MDTKRKDITNKIDIARRVMCVHEVDKGQLGPDELFEIYTGYIANPTLISNNCTFKEYHVCKDCRLKNLDKLRESLIEYYIKLRKVPTLQDIDKLRNSSVVPNKDKYFYVLALHGFLWKNIPGTDKAIFVETYKNIAKRLSYLIKMKEYRKTGRHIVYLQDFSHRQQVKHRSFVAISNKKGVLSLCLNLNDNFTSYDLDSYDDDTSFPTACLGQPYKKKQLLTGLPKTLSSLTQNVSLLTDLGAPNMDLHLDWVKDHVLNLVNEPCVFVFEEFPLSFKDILGPYSSKDVMKEFLDENGIAYGRRAHRFELYELIKRFAEPKMDNFSGIITSQGHEVLMSPYNFHQLDYFHWFWKVFAADFSKEGYRFERLNEAEVMLIEAEEKVFKEDRMMEEVVDKLLTLGKYEGAVDGDLTDYSEVMKYDPELGVETLFVD